MEKCFMNIRHYDEAYGTGRIGFNELVLTFTNVNSHVINEVAEYLGYFGANIWLLKHTTPGQRFDELSEEHCAEIKADMALDWESFLKKYQNPAWSIILADDLRKPTEEELRNNWLCEDWIPEDDESQI